MSDSICMSLIVFKKRLKIDVFSTLMADQVSDLHHFYTIFMKRMTAYDKLQYFLIHVLCNV